MERRLSAIVAADMVGYSRLMEADEIGTIERQKAHREELIEPAFDRFHGRIVKEMGDGVLAEFASVIEAVHCSIEIQRAMFARERLVEEARKIRYRIGINLGDIVVEGSDIYGDGVNVAARLEQLADPGGICLSGTAYDQLGSNVEAGYQALGEVSVKNIARPIRAYKVLLDPDQAGAVIGAPPMRPLARWRLAASGAAAAAAILIAAGLWWDRPTSTAPEAAIGRAAAPFADKPAIAVLPFATIHGNPEQDYLAHGMTEDLITDLAGISGLSVIARNSVFSYMDRSQDIVDIAADLGVGYVVKGSVRKAGGRIRINAQLLDGRSGTHIWAERYDRAAADVFDLQDDVVARIVAALEVKLTRQEEARIRAPVTYSAQAYDLYLRGLQQESYFTPEANRRSMELFERALALDPDFLVAKARLATALTVQAENGWSEDPFAVVQRAQRLAAEVIAVDDTLPQAYWAMARAHTRKELFDNERAIASLEKAIALDPSYADAYAFLTIALQFAGRCEEGLGHIETAIRLNPHYPFWYSFALGACLFHLDRYTDARASLEKAIERNRSWRNSHLYLVPTYGHLGLTDEAEWEMEELRALGFEPTLENFRAAQKIEDPAYRARFLEGVRKAGVPQG